MGDTDKYQNGYNPDTDPAFGGLTIGFMEMPTHELVGTEQVCHFCKRAFIIANTQVLTLHCERTFLDRQISEWMEYACDECGERERLKPGANT